MRYEVTLQPHQRNWVMLDATPTAPALPKHNLHMTAGPAMADRAPHHRAGSLPRRKLSPLHPRPAAARTGLAGFCRFAPSGFNPRTLALAQQWRNETHQNPECRKRSWCSAPSHCWCTGGYQYTLSPGVYGQHSADEFWFDRKLGFCEHIAAAFVILMRGMDIPARIVTGYQGGEANPIDQFWTVRQSRCPRLAEVWLTGQGWVRVDPTIGVTQPHQHAGNTEPLRGVVGTAMASSSAPVLVCACVPPGMPPTTAGTSGC